MNTELIKKNSQYKSILTVLNGNDWLLFMATFVRRINPVTIIFWLYLGSLLVAFLISIFAFNLMLLNSRIWIIGIIGGLLLSLLVTPILHEFIHSFFYKLLGAKKVVFKWSKRLLRFNIYSSDFVLSKKNYYVISLVAFLLFSVTPFTLSFFFNNVLFLLLQSLSIFHSFYALKDLAVCSYLYKHHNSYLHIGQDERAVFYKNIE
ncbi:DUF3267 domain-containing protein [Marivirga arenosa]|uniref:DUF3267 domain-containing protein n=1 Tax=Marivirga arenosa TaxID=3059076 RepID=A0AA51ZXJ3_9BACT|nr:DUF3267 domain-containing protein [Marivirga sp. BKB1-2]WNB18568.1 DUF3267 domain-containing protein [Marivirga sp. BKB1-2]